jgi:hypothetical protein
MNKILLAITILGTGAGGLFTARQSTVGLYREANTTRQAWLAQTQLVNLAQDEQAALTAHLRQMKEALTQAPAVEENALWPVLQTNRIGHLPPELRERLFEELGFNWQSSADYIVVSKETIHDVQMMPLQDDKVTDMAAAVLAITPEERGQVEAAMQRVRTAFQEWASSHIQRTEPKNEVVAQYTMPGADPAVNMSISNNWAAAVCAALGKERAELIGSSGVSGYPWAKPVTLIVKRCSDGNQQRLKFQTFASFGTPQQQGDSSPIDFSQRPFPAAFLFVFPDGWADVAKREGFELPERAPEK